jgi:colicin import membrane protein
MIKQSLDKAAAAEAHAQQIQADKDAMEAKTKQLQFELENTQDPKRIAELQQQLAAEKAKAAALESASPGTSRPVARPAGNAAPQAPKQTGPKPACNCTPGDPLCSCL